MASLNDVDLIVSLASALRDAMSEDDTARSRAVLSTLRQELHVLGLSVDPSGETCPALIRSNGRLRPEGLAALGADLDTTPR